MSGTSSGAPLRIVILGLSITSSWGNGHATTYRGLVRELVRRGHEVLFLERDVPWYAQHRDLPDPPFGRTALYADLAGLRRDHAADVAQADLVIVGSFVPDGVAVGDWAIPGIVVSEIKSTRIGDVGNKFLSFIVWRYTGPWRLASLVA